MMFDKLDVFLTVLVAIMIIANVAIEVKRSKDRTKQRKLDAERVELMKKFNNNVVEFSKIARNLSPNVAEAASLKLLGNSLIEQLLEHGDKMDQLLETSERHEKMLMPMVTFKCDDIDPDELEKMLDDVHTGMISLPREEVTFLGGKTPIDADIVEAFEKRMKYYKQNPSPRYDGDDKRKFLADFEQIDEWVGTFTALNKIQDFETVITLLSGHYYPVMKFGA